MINPKSPPISQDTAMLADELEAIADIRRLGLLSYERATLRDAATALRNPPPGVEREAIEEAVCAQCKGIIGELPPGREPEELCDTCYGDVVAALAPPPIEPDMVADEPPIGGDAVLLTVIDDLGTIDLANDGRDDHYRKKVRELVGVYRRRAAALSPAPADGGEERS